MYLPSNASKARLRDAENARKNRAEIVKALSQGQVSRRDSRQVGPFHIGWTARTDRGLNPFVSSAHADSGMPTGAPSSPLFGAQPFSQPMPRFDVRQRKPYASKVGGHGSDRSNRRARTFWAVESVDLWIGDLT
jgi:hypothetical protein